MFIDTHAHLTFPEFNDDLTAVIQRAKEAKIQAIVNIALDEAAIKKSLQISADNPGYVLMAAGRHPHEAKDFPESYVALLHQLAKEKKIVALGEMGLDYHYKHSPIEIQKEVFARQLQLAQELKLPAIIHSREATADTIEIINRKNHGESGGIRGVLHCFNGDMELARAALKIGLMISFTGNCTFPKAIQIRESIKLVPLENIMIETDCPFLAPKIFRGQRNEPSYVVEVAKQIAEIKKLSIEEVAKQTTKNAVNLFGL